MGPGLKKLKVDAGYWIFGLVEDAGAISVLLFDIMAFPLAVLLTAEEEGENQKRELN